MFRLLNKKFNNQSTQNPKVLHAQISSNNFIFILLVMFCLAVFHLSTFSKLTFQQLNSTVIVIISSFVTYSLNCLFIIFAINTKFNKKLIQKI